MSIAGAHVEVDAVLLWIVMFDGRTEPPGLTTPIRRPELAVTVLSAKVIPVLGAFSITAKA
jgi:hypothetical protein